MEQISTLHAFKRHARPIIAGVLLGLTLIWADAAFASSTQPTEITDETLERGGAMCAREIRAEERARAIPRGLLNAISLAESGRWSDASQESFAWPWTVTTGGKGHFLPSRVDAIAFVKSLQADGVENIDVGCMQINLKYHPHAFSSIEEAFDPAANAAYAATFLRERFNHTGSWIEAAGQYHSTTPELNKAYREKVTRLWQGTPNAATRVANTDDPKTGFARPDRDLTQRFNQAFRARQAGGSVYSGDGQAIANRVHALSPAAILERKAGLGGDNVGGAETRQDRFQQKRQAQLQAWRAKFGHSAPGGAVR